MRLSENTIKAINTLAHKHFGNDCEVYIFGSRVVATGFSLVAANQNKFLSILRSLFVRY